VHNLIVHDLKWRLIVTIIILSLQIIIVNSKLCLQGGILGSFLNF